MKNIDIGSYKADTSINLGKTSTFEDFGATEKELKKDLEKIREELGDFQDILYAHGKYSV